MSASPRGRLGTDGIPAMVHRRCRAGAFSIIALRLGIAALRLGQTPRVSVYIETSIPTRISGCIPVL
jgi:hypothetical protein